VTYRSTDLDTALARLAERERGYALYRGYYHGDHPLAFATDKFRTAFGELFRAFADNLCPAIVDAVADRLELTGFGVETGGADLTAAAWEVWSANRMDRKAGEVHLEAVMVGDAYVLVWPDPITRIPRFYPNRASLMTVEYDEETTDTLLWAAKIWTQADGRVRATLYYPDRIERYVTLTSRSEATHIDARSFEMYAPEEVNPWGVVPVFHFANNAHIGYFGRSELCNALPPQNGLNKALADMLVAMEAVALPQRWMTGVEVPIDPLTGQPDARATRMAFDRILAVANEAARMGEFSQADLTQFLQVQDSFRLQMARNTGTPLHYVQLTTGIPPSGEALKTMEARFVKKCLDRQVAFGNVWEDVMTLALHMAGHDGAFRLAAQWTDPTPRSPLTDAQTIEIRRRIGVTWRQAMEDLDYTAQEIAAMDGERQAAMPVLAPQVPTAMPPVAPVEA